MNRLWIDEKLENKPQVREMATILGVHRRMIVGTLPAVWGPLEWIGRRDGDDLVVDHWSAQDIDDECGTPGFAAAMQRVGWLIVDEARHTVRLPGYIRHVGDTVKERTQKGRERSRKWREKKKREAEGKDPSAHGARSKRARERAPETPASAQKARHTAQRSAAHQEPSSGGVPDAAPGGVSAPRADPAVAKTRSYLDQQAADEAEARQMQEARMRAAGERMAAMTPIDLAAEARRIRDDLRRRGEAGDFVALTLDRRLVNRVVTPEDPEWRRAFADALEREEVAA